MADVNMALGSASLPVHVSRRTASMPYAVERVIDFAEATTTKGSALANADVIQVMVVPPHTICHGAVGEVIIADSASAATVDIDVGGGDDFVDAGDLSTTGYFAPGTNGLLPFGANSVQASSSADYIDMKLNVTSGVVADGKVRVIGFFTDVQVNPGPDVAKRNQLA